MTSDRLEKALLVENLTVRYSGVTAVDEVSLEVGQGEIIAFLGANGAGKSSTLRALAGSRGMDMSGELTFFGERIVRPKAHRMARLGVCLVPEGRRVFAPLTVEDNLLLGGYLVKSRAKLKVKIAEIYDLFPVLAERRNSPAGLLSGGEQQMLAFGRALMLGPRLILMDEPSMGLSPIMIDRVMDAVKTMNESGCSILLVEQNTVAALGVADRAYVLERGCVVHSGDSATLSRDPAVADAFLGRPDFPVHNAMQVADEGGSTESEPKGVGQ